MIVSLQTRFSPLTSVYDTDAPSSSGESGGSSFSFSSGINFSKALMNLIEPYGIVKQGDVTLYEYGKPYPDESAKYKFIAIIAAAGIFIGGAGLFFALGRMSK